MNKFVLILIVSSNIVFGSIASAKMKPVADFQDWGVYSNDTNSCWIASGPLKVENTKNGKPAKNVTRGEIILFVSYFPKKGVLGEVSFGGGYPFKPNQMVELQIGSAKYDLIPEGDFAWPANSDIDTKIRVSMTRGSTATIKAESTRGTKTKDTFSLRGFTAALKDTKKRCGV
jgi:hypothetical protein